MQNCQAPSPTNEEILAAVNANQAEANLSLLRQIVTIDSIHLEKGEG